MPAKLFASVQFTTKTEPTPNDLLVLDKTRYQRNAGSVKGTLRQQFNMCTNYKFSLAKIDRKYKSILDLRLSQCHSCQEPKDDFLASMYTKSVPDTFFFLPGRPGWSPTPGPPQIRARAINAHGSSFQTFAARRYTEWTTTAGGS